MISTKCLHKVCNQCVQSKLEKDGVKGLVCYLCKGVTSTNMYKEDPEINQILKQSQDVLPIYCDTHPIMTCDILCLQCDILTCKKCAKTHHKDHLQREDKIVPLIFKGYLDFAQILLKQQKTSIETLISRVNEARVYEYDFKCSEFTKLYKDVKKLLSSLISDKDDLWKIDLSKYKLKEKPQPQEMDKKAEIVRQQYVHERVPQNNQTQGYQEFIRLVNIELERQQQSLLKTANIIDYNQKQFKLLYQGSRDGFTAQAFHEKCDGKGATVSFILSEFGQTFGGYTSISWESVNKGSSDDHAFIFQLSKQTIHRQYQNKESAVESDPKFLCQFGLINDICIQNDCDKLPYSFCYLGQTYKPILGSIAENIQTKQYLAGKQFFKVIEIEVYALMD
eukprot:403353852